MLLSCQLAHEPNKFNTLACLDCTAVDDSNQVYLQLFLASEPEVPHLLLLDEASSCVAQDDLLKSAVCYEVSCTDQGPGIELTLHDQHCVMTVKEISQLSLESFAAMWTVSGHIRLAHCSYTCTLLHRSMSSYSLF